MDDIVIKYGTRYVKRQISSEAFWKRHWIFSCVVGTFGAVLLSKCVHYLYQWYRLRQLRLTRSVSASGAKVQLGKDLSKTNAEEIWKKIEGFSFGDLLEKLRSRDLKAVDVLHAFQWRALDVDSAVNCLTEPILEAEKYAEDCDRCSTPVGPLHGLPISLQESLPIKGYVSTSGSSKYAGDVCERDCLVISLLKRLGAVPFVKTNVPQFVMSYQCSNPIYGRTVHPLDGYRTPGGVAGGEGALISSGGSLLGFGTDVCGGSRIPAAMCGISSFKPTSLRLSRKGLHESSKIPPHLTTTVCPMSHDVNAIVGVMKHLLDIGAHELDPRVPPVGPFNSDLFTSKDKLRVGYYASDCHVQPVPACSRAVEVAKKTLENLGHTLVPWKPPRIKYAMEVLLVNALLGDHGMSFFDEIRHDKIDSSASSLYYRMMIPEFLRKIVSNMLRPQSPAVAKMLSAGLRLGSIHDYWVLSNLLDDYREEFIEDWKSSKLDAVICPAFATPSLKKEVSSMTLLSYPALYNLVDFPSGVVPVTRVTADDDQKLMDDYQARDMIEKLIKMFSVESHNLPVGVQCVTLPWRDEVCLRVMQELQDSVGFGNR